jgi:hypothetical protein
MTNTFFSGSIRPSSSFYWKLNVIIQNWFNQIENSSRGEFYGIFKNEFNLEKYLLKLLPHERNMITKFRCNNIKLPIETGRWPNTHKWNIIQNILHNDGYN